MIRPSAVANKQMEPTGPFYRRTADGFDLRTLLDVFTIDNGRVRLHAVRKVECERGNSWVYFCGDDVPVRLGRECYAQRSNAEKALAEAAE